MSINGNMVGCYSPIGKTFIIEDDNGNEITGVCVDQETVFTATDDDVREGLVYASDGGVSTGSKFIPPYYARCGCKIVLKDQEVTITVPEYNYNNFMVVITSYNTNIAQSVKSTYISIDNGVYAVGGDTKLSDVIIDANNKRINLGIVVSEKSVLRYFILKEEY